MKSKKKIKKAINIAIRYGQIDGAHHKMWVIDRMLEILAGDEYDKIIADSDPNNEHDKWDKGIAP